MGKLNTVKISDLPSLIYALNTILVKIPASCFVCIGVQILKFIWRPRIAITILREENRVGELTIPDLRTYYKATERKTV